MHVSMSLILGALYGGAMRVIRGSVAASRYRTVWGLGIRV